MRRLAFALLAAALFRGAALGSEAEDDLDLLSGWQSEQDVERARETGALSNAAADDLQALQEDPVRVRAAGAEDLRALPGVSAKDAERGALPPEVLDRVRTFISDDEADGWMGTSGEFRIDRTLRPGNVFASPRADEVAYAVDRMRVTVRQLPGSATGRPFSSGWRAGAVFLTDSVTLARSAAGGPQLDSVRRTRWIKGYLGFESPSARGRPSGGVRQAYLGSYRLGFFEGTERERSSGVLPDTRMFAPASLTPDVRDRRAIPMRGAAAQGGFARFPLALFCASDQHPGEIQLPRPADPTKRSSHTVEDAFAFELAGGLVEWRPAQGWSLGIFGQRMRMRGVLPAFEIAPFDAEAWGVLHRARWNDGQARAVYSRMARTPFTAGGREFIFARGEWQLRDSSLVSAAFKRIGEGYWNPSGTLFSGDDLERWSARWTEQAGDSVRLRADFTRRLQRLGGLLIERRQAGASARWESSADVIVHLAQSVRDPASASVSREWNGDGTLRSARIERAREWRSSAGAEWRAGERFRQRIDAGLRVRQDERGAVDNSKLGHNLRYRAATELFRGWTLGGGVEFDSPASADTDDASQRYYFETRIRPGKTFDISVRWRAIYRQRTARGETPEGLDWEQRVRAYEDQLFVRAAVRW